MRWAKRSMIRLVVLSAIVVGCQGQIGKEKLSKLATLEYPLLIDGGKKVVYHQGGDTITFSNAELYSGDSLRNPLLRFYLSYPEWETISCIISLDEKDYWDKAMIGLVEKTGNLRINYLGQKLYLSPTKRELMKEGEWTGTFISDSLEVQITGLLENKRILRSLTGYDELVLRTPRRTTKEKIFLVYKIR